MALTTLCLHAGYSYYSGIWRTSRSLYIVVNLCSGKEFRFSDCDFSIVEYYDGCSDNAGVTCHLGKNHIVYSTSKCYH